MGGMLCSLAQSTFSSLNTSRHSLDQNLESQSIIMAFEMPQLHNLKQSNSRLAYSLAGIFFWPSMKNFALLDLLVTVSMQLKLFMSDGRKTKIKSMHIV